MNNKLFILVLIITSTTAFANTVKPVIPELLHWCAWIFFSSSFVVYVIKNIFHLEILKTRIIFQISFLAIICLLVGQFF